MITACLSLALLVPLGFVSECLRARIAVFFLRSLFLLFLLLLLLLLLCPMGSFNEPWLVGVSSVGETSSVFHFKSFLSTVGSLFEV